MANFFLALGVVAFFVAIGLCLYGVLILGHEVIKLQGMVEGKGLQSEYGTDWSDGQAVFDWWIGGPDDIPGQMSLFEEG